jgi:hypothetical protein
MVAVSHFQVLSSPTQEALGTEMKKNCATLSRCLHGDPWTRNNETWSPDMLIEYSFEGWAQDHFASLYYHEQQQPTAFAQAPAIFPAVFVLFQRLWGCRKAVAFLRLLFKDILNVATAVPTIVAVAAPVPATTRCMVCDPQTPWVAPQKELAWDHAH